MLHDREYGINRDRGYAPIFGVINDASFGELLEVLRRL
jgi:hypothetical protein